MADKPFAEAAHQNRDAILLVLHETFQYAKNVLELGSGTGQHAVYFAQHLDHLRWQSSDKTSMLHGIQNWIDDEPLPNLPNAIELDVNTAWPDEKFDAAFAANIAHIMHWQDIEALFNGLSKVLIKNAIFCLYGPFNINGKYTSESNQRFDHWLKRRDPHSGLKDKSALDELALRYDFHTEKTFTMPANNMILCWKI